MREGRANHVVERVLAARLLADAHVGEEEVDGAAPVRAAPLLRTVQAAVAGPGETLR